MDAIYQITLLYHLIDRRICWCRSLLCIDESIAYPRLRCILKSRNSSDYIPGATPYRTVSFTSQSSLDEVAQVAELDFVIHFYHRVNYDV